MSDASCPAIRRAGGVFVRICAPGPTVAWARADGEMPGHGRRGDGGAVGPARWPQTARAAAGRSACGAFGFGARAHAATTSVSTPRLANLATPQSAIANRPWTYIPLGYTRHDDRPAGSSTPGFSASARPLDAVLHRDVGALQLHGMRALLILFMTASVATGGLGSHATAGAIYGLYTRWLHDTLPGGWVADRPIGRRAVLTAALSRLRPFLHGSRR